MYEWNWSNTNHNMYDGSVQITLKLWVLKSCKFYTKEIQSLPLSFLPCNIISSQSFDLARWWILDTAHVMRQMELNADSGIKDFFLIVERPNGMVEYSGSLPLEQVVEMLKVKMVHEGTTNVSR